MIKVLLVFGTRPEVIKLAPLIWELEKHHQHFQTKVCVSGQHRQMIVPLLKLFDIRVDYDLAVMKPNQDLAHITSSVLERLSVILEKDKPDWVIVQGDTTTAMAASLAAFYQKIKIAHVEAGLRTWDKENPYPEEINRQLIDKLADIYFAHSIWAKENLIKEGIDGRKIILTGNTVIDTLFYSLKQDMAFKDGQLKKVMAEKRKVILVTAHRRENMGNPILNICTAIRDLAKKYPKDIVFIYPVHLNPNIHGPVLKNLSSIENVILTKPLEYLPFVHLMKKSFLILTDSGGLQEEAPSLGKPVLVLRQTTERPEGIKAGCVKLVGTNKMKIKAEIELLIQNSQYYQRMAHTQNPYGDGKASHRMVAWLKKHQ